METPTSLVVLTVVGLGSGIEPLPWSGSWMGGWGGGAGSSLLSGAPALFKDPTLRTSAFGTKKVKASQLNLTQFKKFLGKKH